MDAYVYIYFTVVKHEDALKKRVAYFLEAVTREKKMFAHTAHLSKTSSCGFGLLQFFFISIIILTPVCFAAAFLGSPLNLLSATSTSASKASLMGFN